MSLELQSALPTLPTQTQPLPHRSGKAWAVAATVSAVCLAFFVDTVCYKGQGVQYLQQMCHKTADWVDANVTPVVIPWYNIAEKQMRSTIASCKDLYLSLEAKATEVYKWATNAPLPLPKSTSWTSYLWSA
ncbi:MAG: hypothetical protein RLZZ453_702 [Chlamydiota bacterium]|jgi:hypothetical protein